jgi:ATP-dependent Clp protease ATP-binding subunit ClpA
MMDRMAKIRGRRTRDPASTILDRVGLEVTSLLSERPIGSTRFWELEVERMLEILQRRERHNILLEGAPGVGKRTMLLRLAAQIRSGPVPPHFRRLRIVEITLSSILSLIKEPEDFERILFLALREAAARRDTIIYINQLENFLSGGESESALFDGSYILEMSTRDPAIRLVASISSWGYQRYRALHPWIVYQMEHLRIVEPSVEAAEEILKMVRPRLERFHGVSVRDEAIKMAVSLTHRYLKERVLPGKAIEILDEAAARAVVRKSGRRGKPVVGRIEVAHALASRTGISVEKITARLGGELIDLDQRLRERVRGQDHVVDRIVDVIRVVKLGLTANPTRPDGIFLFVGPSGVGKNELALTLARELFGGDEHLIRVDMAQYAGDNGHAKLFGQTAEEGKSRGILTSAVERVPNAVIVIDEVERAHPDVANTLMQVFRDGGILDPEGRRVSFSNATIIVTTNSENISPRNLEGKTVGFADADDTRRKEQEQKQTETAVKQFFSSEFLELIDEVLYFKPLSVEAVQEIADLRFLDIEERLRRKGIDLEISKGVRKMIADRGFSVQTGAHNLKKTIEAMVLNPISRYLLKHPEARKLKLVMSQERVEVRQ